MWVAPLGLATKLGIEVRVTCKKQCSPLRDSICMMTVIKSLDLLGLIDRVGFEPDTVGILSTLPLPIGLPVLDHYFSS